MANWSASKIFRYFIEPVNPEIGYKVWIELEKEKYNSKQRDVDMLEYLNTKYSTEKFKNADGADDEIMEQNTEIKEQVKENKPLIKGEAEDKKENKTKKYLIYGTILVVLIGIVIFVWWKYGNKVTQ